MQTKLINIIFVIKLIIIIINRLAMNYELPPMNHMDAVVIHVGLMGDVDRPCT